MLISQLSHVNMHTAHLLKGHFAKCLLAGTMGTAQLSWCIMQKLMVNGLPSLPTVIVPRIGQQNAISHLLWKLEAQSSKSCFMVKFITSLFDSILWSCSALFIHLQFSAIEKAKHSLLAVFLCELADPSLHCAISRKATWNSGVAPLLMIKVETVRNLQFKWDHYLSVPVKKTLTTGTNSPSKQCRPWTNCSKGAV